MRIKILVIFFSLLGLGACSTQKNTWLSRNYNAMTARYNTLYNGTQSFKKGEKQLQQGRQDNYMAVLPLFPYSGPAQDGMVTGDMERAVAKGLKAIQKKAIKVRPKKMPDKNSPRYEALVNKREFNPAIDDAYLLVGKAELYNHNFVEAQSFLDFAFREFPGDWAQYEILLWQARVRMETGEWDNAKVLLDRYDAMGQAPLKYYGEYAATYAQWFIGMKQYNSAIPLLMDAAEMAPSRWDKIRRFYVLGQLYQITGQQTAAMEAFRQVIRLNPSYETALNAGIAHATAMAVATHDFAAARSELEKMVGQVKNEDFRDRLYFAIAETYLSEQDTANVVLNLKLAAGYNNGNENVLRETYLLLGDLFFSQHRYISSFAYYDSTLVMMPVDDERYKDVNFRHRGLKDLTTHLLVVQHEDSLLRLAALSPEQQSAFVEAVIERARLKQIEKELNMESSDFGSDQFFNNSTTGLSNNTANQSDGEWYFYNTTTASMGKMEFERKWGRRSLRDNWRRSDLGAAEPQVQTADVPEQREERDMSGMPEMPGMEEAGTPGQSESGSALPDKKRLLDGIPSTPEQISASKEKKARALFQVGMIFYDYFEAFDEAGNCFNRFLVENQSHELTEEVLFWNYMACAKMKNQTCMNQMRQQLTSLFPEGKYAAYVSDPDFGDRQLALMKVMNETYKQAFEAYRNLDFKTTRLLTSRVIQEAEDVALVRKALLLRAMAEGKSGNSPGFERELVVLSSGYPETEEGLLAQHWLDMIREGRQPVKQTVNSVTDDSSINENLSGDEASDDNLFKYEPQNLHFVWFMVEPMADINRLLFNVADYNFSRFLVSSYDISIDKIPSGQRSIVIGPFNNRGEAMDYYFALRSRVEVFKVDSARHILLLSGSENNRNAFMSSGDISGYSRFFSSHYLEGGKGMDIDLTFVGTTVEAADTIANKPSAVPVSISPETAIIDEAVTDTEALQTSPSSNARYRSEGLSTLLIQVPQRTDLRRVAGFITAQAYNNFNIRVSVKQLTLSGGESLILVETFPNEEALSQFTDLLRGNTFWQSQLKAANWPLVPVNAFNLDVIKNDGSINNYLNWIETR